LHRRKEEKNDAEEPKPSCLRFDSDNLGVVSFSREGSLKRQSVLSQGLADLPSDDDEFGGVLYNVANSIRGGKDSPTSEGNTHSSMGFQPIPGVISPMMSPPPMLMPTPVHSMMGGGQQSLMMQQQQMQMMPPGAAGGGGGGGAEQAAMAFTYVPVPVYNMSGVAIPGMGGGQQGMVSPVKMEDNKEQQQQQHQQQQQPPPDYEPMQQQQMYQQAFLQNAVAQNMQIQQQLLMQNQASSIC
jgi:hypothetical protein